MKVIIIEKVNQDEIQSKRAIAIEVQSPARKKIYILKGQTEFWQARKSFESLEEIITANKNKARWALSPSLICLQ
jgi:hypothetical protein